MGLHVFWPASACITLFVVGVIMVILKYGERICGRRSLRQVYTKDWEAMEDAAYTLEISESVA